MFALCTRLPYQDLQLSVRVDCREFLQGIKGTELALVICTETEVMNHPWPPYASSVKAFPIAHPPLAYTFSIDVFILQELYFLIM